MGTLGLRVPRDREDTFRTELFQRCQRSEKALVLALMEIVVNGVRRKHTDEMDALRQDLLDALRNDPPC